VFFQSIYLLQIVMQNSVPNRQLLPFTPKAHYTSQSPLPLRIYVEQALREYLVRLEGQAITDLYELVLFEIELPLFKVILEYAKKNKTQAADLLGLSRSTLRKKLIKHNLIQE
jgi:Fis family transcriptional regulator, factor for inversion stimulation protein